MVSHSSCQILAAIPTTEPPLSTIRPRPELLQYDFDGHSLTIPGISIHRPLLIVSRAFPSRRSFPRTRPVLHSSSRGPLRAWKSVLPFLLGLFTLRRPSELSHLAESMAERTICRGYEFSRVIAAIDRSRLWKHLLYAACGSHD